MYRALFGLVLTLVIIVQMSFVKNIENAANKIEYQEEKKSQILKPVYCLYGFYISSLLAILISLVLFF